MSNFSPMFFEQPVVIFDTTESLSPTTGAFVLYGGLSINATYDSSDISSGGFVLSGGMAVKKNISVGGIQHIYNTTDSTGIDDGALIVDGGVGIKKSLHVGGDTTILGSLFVQGTYTYVNTQTINVEDNTLVINSGPAGSRDAGLLIRRDGVDVTSDVAITSGTLAGLEGVNGTSITFGATHSQPDDHYRGWWVKLNSGNGYAQIQSYSNNVAVLSTTGNTFTTGNLTETGFTLYNKSYLGQYYDEQSDEIRFAYVADAQDPKVDLENGDNYARLRLDRLDANTTISTASIQASGNSTIANLAITNLLVASVTMDNAALKSATIGNLYVTGASVLHGAVTAGALNVTGDSILQGFVTAGALAVTGESFLRGAVTAGALNVTGDSILQGFVTAGALAVTGESFLRGAVTAGALNVTGNSILQGFVTAGALAVTGESFLRGAVTAGALNVTGDSILQGFVTAGALAVTGESFLRGAVTAGALNVTGNSILQGFVTAGALAVTGESFLRGAVTAGALNVTGNSILQGFVTAGSLNVTGDSILENNLLVTTGNVTISTNDYSPIKEATSASGGSILFNTVDVSPSLGDIARERYARIVNNQTSAINVTGFAFNGSVRAFDAIVSVVILAESGNKYAYYNLKGIKKASNWVVNSSYVGDVTGVTFSITNGGQMQYTSTNVVDHTKGYANFRAITTSTITPEPTFT